MAEAQGVSKATVNRLWQLHNLKPHLSRTFKLSRDARFLEKLTDVVGLYLNPPQKAVVLCLDEKSQIQALDRTQPGLPLKKGRCGTMTHDYKRNGTTTLFAALNPLDGKVIGECHGRHRHQEWLKFLRRLDREFPAEHELHLVMDNYGTHKEPHVKAWLKKHPRFVCHFVPTSSSWLNLVERWFEELSEKAIRRGSFVSVPDLQQAIDSFLVAWNAKPKYEPVGDARRRTRERGTQGARSDRAHSQNNTLKWRCVFGLVSMRKRIWRHSTRSYVRPLSQGLGVRPHGRSS